MLAALRKRRALSRCMQPSNRTNQPGRTFDRAQASIDRAKVARGLLHVQPERFRRRRSSTQTRRRSSPSRRAKPRFAEHVFTRYQDMSSLGPGPKDRGASTSRLMSPDDGLLMTGGAVAQSGKSKKQKTAPKQRTRIRDTQKISSGRVPGF